MDARYMLALCYFRNNEFQRTLLTLDQQAASLTPAMRFLAAQAALQLKDYARAEEVLLKDCRMQFQSSREFIGGSNHVGGTHPMDDWIVQTTVSE
jgi:hypothetical protein